MLLLHCTARQKTIFDSSRAAVDVSTDTAYVVRRREVVRGVQTFPINRATVRVTGPQVHMQVERIDARQPLRFEQRPVA